jgi:uncharacterized protein (TIGR02145 family)
MKKVNLILILFVCLGTISFSQTVTIGTQVWMTKNLDVSKFRNGDPIPEAKTEEEWRAYVGAGEPAYCYYHNDHKNGKKYGKLYNWYAVNDARGLAPAGWHIPSDDDWTILTDYLGGVNTAGYKMKSKSGWEENGNGTNSSGFSGLPGGSRALDPMFSNNSGLIGSWWSSSEGSPHTAWYRLLSCKDGSVDRYDTGKGYGKSVRCLRD